MIDVILQLFIYVIIADVILSWVPDARNNAWARKLHEFADAPQKPIREMLPKGMPLDPTPMIIIMLCQILMYLF